MSNMSWGKHLKQSGLLMSLAVAIALSPIVYAEAAISQGFKTDDEYSPGMIVSSRTGERAIELTATNNDERIIGVVSNTSLIELSNERNQVQVATSGLTQTLISDMNGEVKAGDSIAASPLKGVGMKATDSSYVVGVARADFATVKNTVKRTVMDKDGRGRTVTVGLLAVQVGVTYFEPVDDNSMILPQFFFNVAQIVAGRDVSVIRVLIALVVLLVGVLSIGVLLYASVRSSIISIGRNPLAASAVNRSLLEVSALSIGVLVLMLGAVYLVLAL